MNAYRLSAPITRPAFDTASVDAGAVIDATRKRLELPVVFTCSTMPGAAAVRVGLTVTNGSATVIAQGTDGPVAAQVTPTVTDANGVSVPDTAHPFATAFDHVLGVYFQSGGDLDAVLGVLVQLGCLPAGTAV